MGVGLAASYLRRFMPEALLRSECDQITRPTSAGSRMVGSCRMVVVPCIPAGGPTQTTRAASCYSIWLQTAAVRDALHKYDACLCPYYYMIQVLLSTVLRYVHRFRRAVGEIQIWISSFKRILLHGRIVRGFPFGNVTSYHKPWNARTL